MKKFKMPAVSLPGELLRNQTEFARYYIILFILWPFLAFITALSNYGQKEAKKIVFIFLIYYGLTYVIADAGYYVDAAGYATELKANSELPFSDFLKIAGGLYSQDDSVDIYEPLVSFFVSRFTNDHRILFAVFAAVFAFFYLRSVNILYTLYQQQQQPGWDSLIHLIFFSLIVPITLINGVRMWTAAWIFFYGAIHVIWYRDARYLILAFSSTLVHFSFLSVNILLLAYYYLGNRNYFYLPLTIASFFVPDLVAPFIQSNIYRLGSSIQNRVQGYTSEEYILGVQEHSEQNAWFVQMGNDLVFYYLIIGLIIIQILYRHKEEIELNLFSFILLLISFVNFGNAIPSFGSRFKLVFFLFGTLYLFLHYLKTSGNKISLLTLVGLFPMLLYVLLAFRIGSVSINAWIFIPGISLPFFLPDLSVADIFFN